MLVKLFRNTSPVNQLDKNLVDDLSFNVVLKRAVDVVAPELILASIPGSDFRDYNYAQIEDLNRSYFITGVESVSGVLWRLSLECDVVSTYKTEVLNSTARFVRGIKTGDRVAKDLIAEEFQTVTKSVGDYTMVDTHTNIITVVEGPTS